MSSIRVGDVARLRKKHPCGGFEWEVTRLGADIRLKCTTCMRRVIISREDFDRRAVSVRESDD